MPTLITIYNKIKYKNFSNSIDEVGSTTEYKDGHWGP